MAPRPMIPVESSQGTRVQAGDVRACRAAARVDDDHLAGQSPGAAAIEFHADGTRADERAFPADQLQSVGRKELTLAAGAELFDDGTGPVANLV